MPDVKRRKSATPLAPTKGAGALYARYGIEIHFVIDRMIVGKSPEVQMMALISFAEHLGDAGYEAVFRESLAREGARRRRG